MFDFVIVHGSFGSPFENWTPWLYEKLIEKEKNVLAPQLPVINQNYDNWQKIFSVYDDYIGENTSIVAHSLGPAFVINYLLDNKKKVNNLYFVAPFYGLINIKEFDDVNQTFFKYESLKESKKYFNKASCFISNNDPYVPSNMSIDFSNQLDSRINIVENGGHFNKSAGYTKFNELLKVIEENG